MKPQPILELKRRLNRLRYGGSRRARAATRNVTVLWTIAAVGLFLGVWLRMYAGDGDVAAIFQSTGTEWRDAVQHVSSSIPKTINFVAGPTSWEAAALQSALPRNPRDDELGGPAKALGRRVLHLALGLLLGYDVEGGDGALIAGRADGEGALRSTDREGAGTGPAERTSSMSETATTPSGTWAASSGVGDAGANGAEAGLPASTSTSFLGAAASEPSVAPSPAPADVVLEPATGGAERLVKEAEEEEASVPASSTVRSPTGGSGQASGPGQASGSDSTSESRSTSGAVPPPKAASDRQSPLLDPVRNDLSSPRLSPSGTCRVLIFHTHTSETYRTDDGARAADDEHHLWNSTDSGILHVGRALANALEEKYAVPTCHATAIHDWPSHARAYIESRTTVEQYLQRYPQIDLVLDIHRDSPPELVTTVAGRPVARVAVVVGTHPTMHPRSATNVALANHFARMLEGRHPGMFRRVIERPDARLNQDLHPRMLLLEIGSYDTHLDEALAAAELLAEVVADMVVDIRLQRLPGVGSPR